jgi:choice-of-anchor B domain-containing protein
MMRFSHILGAFALLAGGPLASQTHPSTRPVPAGGALGFGVSVALQGDHLFVGRTGAVPGFPMPPAQAGAVHVFRRGADGSWTETATLTGSDTRLGDGFGSALVARDNWVIVGAPAANDRKGAAYVFVQRPDGTWNQVSIMSLPDGAPGDEFGARLAATTEVLLVGLPGRDSARGAVAAYRRSGMGQRPEALLTAGDAQPGDRFGAALALQDDQALIGAPGPAPGGFLGGPQPKDGAAYLFQGAPGRWTQAAKLTAGTDTARAFGSAVLLDGDVALVSAPIVPRASGTVYHFRRSGETWSLAGRVTPAEPAPQAMFGASLARAGADLLVGAPFAEHGGGAVYVFAASGGGVVERQRLTVRSIGLGSGLGLAMAAAADLAVIGGPMAEFFEGTGFVFGREPSGEWRERGTVVDHTPGLAAITGGERRCERGAVQGFPCQDVDLEAFIPVSALGGKRGIMVNDIWGWTDPRTGREYALVGRMDGTAFVDVTDAANPVYLGELPLHQGATPNLWRDIKVYKDHAFIVADGAGPHGMQVFDLTQLRDVRVPPVTFQETAHYDRIHSAHNVAINEATGFAYPIGNSGGGETCGGALHMIDIRDPKHPAFAGCYADPTTGNAGTGYTHDAQCVTYQGPDARYRDHEICFNASETAVGIADVTEKARPRPLSVAAYPNVGYTHQGWLSDDHRYFFVDDELDEIAGSVPKTRTLVWDVTDLEDPVLHTEYLGTTSASDHNLYVRGRYMYQSNYVSGLRVVDIADPKNPTEVGYFDTVPYGDNVPGFAGSWSNYPFFKSGTIIVTSMREGLFVLKHRQMQLVP